MNDMKMKIPGGEERILLVDDDENVLNSLGHFLKHLKYNVVTKKNGAEALKIFKVHSESFDLVITDQVMPGILGIELARLISDIRPDIPIVLCTGFSDKIDRKKIEKTGIREIVSKPVNTTGIAQTIRRALDE
jgi:CheY-like chemotaxis protein